MIFHSVSELNRGNSRIPAYFAAALERWRTALDRPNGRNPEALGAWARAEQRWFETNCGGRLLGREIMGVAGISGLADPEAADFDLGKAHLVAEAIRKANVSAEVQNAAAWAAREWGVEE